jgi:hypothetical protein
MERRSVQVVSVLQDRSVGVTRFKLEEVMMIIKLSFSVLFLRFEHVYADLGGSTTFLHVNTKFAQRLCNVSKCLSSVCTA